MTDIIPTTQPNFCPSCGRAAVYRVLPEWLLTHYNGTAANILATLIEARREHRTLNISELAAGAYADRSEPPLSAERLTRDYISALNGELPERGWTILGKLDTGTGYYIAPLQLTDG